MTGIGTTPVIQRKLLNGKKVLILLKNSVTGSSGKFLASLTSFVLSDMRGHKKNPRFLQRPPQCLIRNN
jgi:hypothetical protein